MERLTRTKPKHFQLISETPLVPSGLFVWLLKLKLVLVEKRGEIGAIILFDFNQLIVDSKAWKWVVKDRIISPVWAVLCSAAVLQHCSVLTNKQRYLRRNERRWKVAWPGSAGHRWSSTSRSATHRRSRSGAGSRRCWAAWRSRRRRSRGWTAGRRRLPVVRRTGLRLAVGGGGQGGVVSPDLGHTGVTTDGGGGDVSYDLQRLLAGVVHPQHLLPSEGLVGALLHHTVL